MQDRRFEVFQDLLIEEIVETGPTSLTVKLVDETGPRGSVMYQFDSPRAHQSGKDRLMSWYRAGAQLTYVRGDGTGVLLDEEEVFRRAMEDDGAPSW